MSTCVDIFNEAFATDPALLYFHPHSDPKMLKERSLKKYENSFTEPGTKYFKAVHVETGWVQPFSLPPSYPLYDEIVAGLDLFMAIESDLSEKGSGTYW
jgi:hypothetical protein